MTKEWRSVLQIFAVGLASLGFAVLVLFAGYFIGRSGGFYDAEKERVAKALHAVADYLAGKFETLIEPLREVMKWEWILEHVGTGALQSVAEQGRVISREIPAKLLAATKPYEFELGLVGIEPMLIKTKTVEFDNILHGVASVAANLKEPNIASARLSCEAFAREFQVFQDELERVKNQIGETRRKLANGELG
jgi:hypothetical protein